MIGKCNVNVTTLICNSMLSKEFFCITRQMYFDYGIMNATSSPFNKCKQTLQNM